MIEADVPSTEVLQVQIGMMCASHRGWSCSHHPRPRATLQGRKAKAAPGRGPQSAAKVIIEAGVLHLASLQQRDLILREDCYNVVTRAPTVGNDCVVPDSKREKGVHARAMLFWVLAALAVVGALAIDWGLYLLVRRWL
jgi:hypothetical protein